MDCDAELMAEMVSEVLVRLKREFDEANLAYFKALSKAGRMSEAHRLSDLELVAAEKVRKQAFLAFAEEQGLPMEYLDTNDAVVDEHPSRNEPTYLDSY
jgi:hypothetical protein